MIKIKNFLFGKKENPIDFAYYKFDSNALDSGLNSVNGSLVGAPTFTTGKVGNAINFRNDAALRYVNFADNNFFSMTNGISDIPFSFSFWVNFSSFSSIGNWIFSKRNNSDNLEYQISYSTNNGLRFQMFSNGGNSSILAATTAQLSTNQWYHVVVTYDGSSTFSGIKIFIDKILQNLTNTSTGTYVKQINGSAIARIGDASWIADVSTKHRGLLDEFIIIKGSAISESEVIDLYNNGNNGIPYN